MRHKIYCGGRIKVTASTSCPNEAKKKGVHSWSLKHIQTQRDADTPIGAGLNVALRKMGVHKAYAPNVARASARIVAPHELKERIVLKDTILYRGSIPADGILLGKGRAFVMSGAGCPVIVASDGYDTIVAHAGRDSLVDRGAVMGKPTRRHISVVNAILDALMERGAALDAVQMCMLFSIPAARFEHDFNHVAHGEYNHKLAKFINDRWHNGTIICHRGGMFLDLEVLFEEQAYQAGVTNTLCMYSLSELPHLAHTRDGKGSDRRNLIIIKRDQ